MKVKWLVVLALVIAFPHTAKAQVNCHQGIGTSPAAYCTYDAYYSGIDSINFYWSVMCNPIYHQLKEFIYFTWMRGTYNPQTQTYTWEGPTSVKVDEVSMMGGPFFPMSFAGWKEIRYAGTQWARNNTGDYQRTLFWYKVTPGTFACSCPYPGPDMGNTVELSGSSYTGMYFPM